MLDHEKGDVVHFCALQSQTAKDFFHKRGFPEPDLSTFYFWDGHRLFERSTAALTAAGYLKTPWSWLRLFRIVPRFIRDAVYNWIARRRHRLAAEQCALPSVEQRKRFL